MSSSIIIFDPCNINATQLPNARRIAEISALDAEREPSILVFETAGASGSQAVFFEAVKEVRQKAMFCGAPLIFSASLGPLDLLSDGVLNGTRAELLAKSENILERACRITAEPLSHSSKLRFLSYFYARGAGYEMKPALMPGERWLYGYPVASVMIEPAVDKKPETASCPGYHEEDMERAAQWLSEALDRGYVERTQLYDRVRICPSCGSGRLNYVDLCPECGSLNIEKTRMVHCFTCGHVAPESGFVKDFSLACPRCGTKLRHIGSDYDHPLESWLCGDCSTAFVEPEVKVSCLDCGGCFEPEQLLVRNFYGYKLSRRGEEAVLTGLISEDYMLFTGTVLVGEETFMSLVKWIRLLRRRYADARFALICIKLEGMAEAEAVIGQPSLLALVDELGRRISSFVRETDITMKSSIGKFWVLLPRSDRDGAEILASRIMDMASLFDEKGVPEMKIAAKCFVPPDDDEDPARMLSRFAEEV